MIEVSFDNQEYGSYPWNTYFGDWPVEYKQRLFTKLPIDNLTNNIVENLIFSSIKLLFDNWMYKINPQNDDFNDFYFDGDDRFITRQQIYHINDDIV